MLLYVTICWGAQKLSSSDDYMCNKCYEGEAYLSLAMYGSGYGLTICVHTQDMVQERRAERPEVIHSSRGGERPFHVKKMPCIKTRWKLGARCI